MVRPLWLTTLAGRCVAMKFAPLVVSYLILSNHHRLKHGVVVSESVFFCNDKAIMAYCSFW